jgi:CAAX protease family protein
MIGDASPMRDSLIQRHPASSYFVMAFAISWLGAMAVALPYLTHGESVPKLGGLMMFPAMLLGPSLAGIVLTARLQGWEGWRNLVARMTRLGSLRWLAILLLPPVLVAATLWCLTLFVSPAFRPNRFLIGLSFGVAAGFIEEIGWTGFAFPAMRRSQNGLRAAIVLGVLWGLWHAPVIDYLGSATPHGRYWLPFFLAFIFAMAAVRVLICWVAANTRGLLLPQLLHASSTGALVALSPFRVTASQEALWYAAYGVVLWGVVALVVARFGKYLVREKLSVELTGAN